MGVAYEGYCYPDIDSLLLYLNSYMTINSFSSYHIKKPVIAASDATSIYIPLTLQSMSLSTPRVFTDYMTINFRPPQCSSVGYIKDTPFDPANLDTGVLSLAFSSGFSLVSLPILFSIGVSVILKQIRGR